MNEPTVGYIGLHHHHTEPYLVTLDELSIEVSSVCEPNEAFDPSTIDGLGDLPHYHDPIELLDAESPDVVWVSLSNRDTPAVIEAAMERDIDVYTEKPAGRRPSEVEPLLETEANSDSTVCVSYTWRGHPGAHDLRERARDGFFGDVRAVEARFNASQLQFRDTDHYLFDPDASRGGIVQWLGIHWIDLLPWILEDPIVRVDATFRSESEDVSLEDGAIVQLEFESGAIGTLHCGYYLREGRYETMLSVTGMDGRFTWDPMGDFFGFDDETTIEIESTPTDGGVTPRQFLTYEYNPVPGYGGSYGRAFIEQFFAARSSSDIDVPADLSDALEVLYVLDAIYESAESDQPVTVSRSA